MRFADMAIFQLSPSVTRTKVTGPEVLEGFKQLLRLIDSGYKGDVPVATTKKLVAEYLPFLKQAAREIQLDIDRRGEIFSWDEITDATKNSDFFQSYPNLLLELNPDLVRISQTYLRNPPYSS
jgi:hypothetical protein